MAPLTFFSANTHLSDSRLEKERLLSGNIQLYYHHLWMSSWDLGKSKLLKQIIACVCVRAPMCVCRPVTRSLGWKSEWEPWRRRVKAWGRHQHSGDVTKPLCTGSSQTLRQAYLLPLRDMRTHTHTPSVLESHWQPLHKHKEAKLCHCQDQSLGGSVCAFEGLFSPGYGQSKKRVLNLSESV